MKPILLNVCLLFLLIGCQSDSKSSQNNSTKAHPTTPESVARLWQTHIDKNEFNAAKTLSTSRGKDWINGIQSFLEGEDMDELITTTNFLNMNCVENGMDAFCVYVFKGEEGDIFQDTFFLKKENNYWFVDILEDEGVPTEEDLMEFFVEE
jgi:hypothetical protein